jgi:hypothetical protein
MDILKNCPPFVHNTDHSLKGKLVGNLFTKIRLEAFPWQPQKCNKKKEFIYPNHACFFYVPTVPLLSKGAIIGFVASVL